MKLWEFSDFLQEMAHEGFAIHDVVISDEDGNKICPEKIEIIKNKETIEFILKR